MAIWRSYLYVHYTQQAQAQATAQAKPRHSHHTATPHPSHLPFCYLRTGKEELARIGRMSLPGDPYSPSKENERLSDLLKGAREASRAEAVKAEEERGALALRLAELEYSFRGRRRVCVISWRGRIMWRRS